MVVNAGLGDAAPSANIVPSPVVYLYNNSTHVHQVNGQNHYIYTY